jgi:hypothetical protein
MGEQRTGKTSCNVKTKAFCRGLSERFDLYPVIPDVQEKRTHAVKTSYKKKKTSRTPGQKYKAERNIGIQIIKLPPSKQKINNITKGSFTFKGYGLKKQFI